MMLSRRKFSAEFKLRAVRQVEAGASVAAVARRHEIHPTLLSKWRQQLRRDPERAFQRDREPNDEQVQVSELEQMLGRLTMENALLKKALARHCHVNRVEPQSPAWIPFQAAALAVSHTLNASFRNRLNVSLLHK